MHSEKTLNWYNLGIAYPALMELLNSEDRDPEERTIIFVNTKKQADFIVSNLYMMPFSS